MLAAAGMVAMANLRRVCCVVKGSTWKDALESPFEGTFRQTLDVRALTAPHRLMQAVADGLHLYKAWPPVSGQVAVRCRHLVKRTW